MRLRLAVTAIVVVLVLAAAALTGALQYGAQAVQLGYGLTQSTSGTASGRQRVWFGVEIRNTSAVPVVLREVRALGGENARLVTARVLDHRAAGDTGIAVVGDPLPRELRYAMRPAAGFELPPGSRDRYELDLLVEREQPGRQAAITGVAVAYRALGFDQGATSDAVSCIRAPGADGCPLR